MKQINIRASYDSFRQLREEGSYYVDKTMIIKEYLTDRFDRAVLFARPHRFGKTMTMTMFRDFLDIRRDSRDIFSGLRIMDCKETVDAYMNQYPVVFLSLKELYGSSFDEIYSNFQIAVSELCEDNLFLIESDSINESSKDFLLKLHRKESGKENTIQVLSLLSRMLRQHYGKPAFIIIDEYDVPMSKALGTPAYDSTRDMIEHMLSYVCKTNENVKAVILSGCLYSVKNSAYTGVNNVTLYSVLSYEYSGYIGFTEEDVKKLLNDAGVPEHMETVREWYNGYIFGETRMYCPWDVLKHVNSLIRGTYRISRGPENYWVNTSDTALNAIYGFLGKTANVTADFEKLMANQVIEKPVDEYLPYDRLYEDGDNIWTALLETGYLTKADTENYLLMSLRIPNKEVQNVFQREVWRFFKDKIDNVYVTDLVNALWAGETERAERAAEQILEATLSYFHEYREYSYHLILDGFFTGCGYRVISEAESGYGRSDLIVMDPARSRSMVLELKHVKDGSEMPRAMDEAQSQIIEQKYAGRLRYEGYREILRYGMAFCGKKMMVKQV